MESLLRSEHTPKDQQKKYQCKIIAEVCGAMLEIIQKVKQKCQQLQFWGHTEPGWLKFDFCLPPPPNDI